MGGEYYSTVHCISPGRWHDGKPGSGFPSDQIRNARHRIFSSFCLYISALHSILAYKILSDGKTRWQTALADGSIERGQNLHTRRVHEISRQSETLLKKGRTNNRTFHERCLDTATSAAQKNIFLLLLILWNERYYTPETKWLPCY